jgi:hypothetical protein
VGQVERLVELDTKLPGILRGSAQPASAAERIELANLCLVKKRPGTAARFFADAFAAQPALAEDLKAGDRYNAACAAALADAGIGEGAAKTDDKERSRLRQQALDWLEADLKAWSHLLGQVKPQDRQTLQRTLQHWQRDPDLVSVRDVDALADLPAEERQAWQQLWADVDHLLAKANSPE